MKMLLTSFSLFLSITAFASDPCANFASMYAVNAVTSDLVLEGKEISEHSFFVEDSLVIEFEN